jgi:glutamate/tyrosine decarboxylase-like PLP-dependent enzyme
MKIIQIRLGKSGYRSILETGMKNAEYLRDGLDFKSVERFSYTINNYYYYKGLREMGLFDIVDKAHMPLVAFSLKDNHAKYSLFDVQDRLKACGWIVPAYRCPIGTCTFLRLLDKTNLN